MAIPYNPFGKPLSKIAVDDLQKLTEVSEGWYVEYKSQAIKPIAIAKSLTSFANQYGGYLIFGVAQKSKKDLKGGSFPGIPQSDLPNLLTHIRDSSASHSNPAVHFEQIVLAGPCKEIGLPADKSVVVVEIQQGMLAPHIHSSGRIFRRIGDSSEPQPETDRFQLGELFGRREKLAVKYKSFIKRTDPTKRNQGISGWLQLYMFPDPNSPTRGSELTLSLMTDVFGKVGAGLPGPRAPMTSVYPTGLGFTATQFGGGEPNTLGLSVHVSHSGNACFCMPVNLNPSHSFETGSYVYGTKFAGLLAGKSHHKTTIADFSKTIIGITAFFGQLLHLKDALGDDRDMTAGFRLSGLLGAVPFVDSEVYISGVEMHGVPILDFDTFEFPTLPLSVDDLLCLKYSRLEKTDKEMSAYARPYLFGQIVMTFVLSCVGVSGLFDKFDDQLLKDVFMNFGPAPSETAPD